MAYDDSKLAEITSLNSTSIGAPLHVDSLLHKEASDTLAAKPLAGSLTEKPAGKPEVDSLLDVALGSVIKDKGWERGVAEATKAGAVFFGGKYGLAATVALYALDQVKVDDTLGQGAVDATLGAAKGTAMRGINLLAAARDFNFAAQAFSLGLGSRALDAALNRQTWVDNNTHCLAFDQGRKIMLDTALDRDALVTDLGAFALGGAFSVAANHYTGNFLKGSPFLRTSLAGGAFGLAVGGVNEVKREHDNNEKFDYAKIAGAGAKQAAFNFVAATPAGAKAANLVTNAHLEKYVKVVGEKGNYNVVYNNFGKSSTLWSFPSARVPKLTELSGFDMALYKTQPG